jgi:hypothetical protein
MRQEGAVYKDKNNRYNEARAEKLSTFQSSVLLHQSQGLLYISTLQGRPRYNSTAVNKVRVK